MLIHTERQKITHPFYGNQTNTHNADVYINIYPVELAKNCYDMEQNEVSLILVLKFSTTKKSNIFCFSILRVCMSARVSVYVRIFLRFVYNARSTR